MTESKNTESKKTSKKSSRKTAEQTIAEAPESTPEDKKQRIREAVRYFYDLQKLRIQMSNRAGSDTIIIDAKDQAHHDNRAKDLRQMEARELRHVKRLCASFPIYAWLEEQKGCGPTMAGVIISEVDISRASTPSALHSYAGLAVVDGKAPRPVKGQKLPYNKVFKTKMVGVLADCMIKANSPWRKHYDDYKHRKQHELVDKCGGCEGTKKSTFGENKGKKCKNCDGTGGPAPWGKSDGHRNNAAKRYMMKMFLLELWKVWRELEGLEICAPYSEAVLGRTHGDHGGMNLPQPSALH